LTTHSRQALDNLLSNKLAEQER